MDSVLSIPVSWGWGSDSLLWHFDKSRGYTVQSGYRLALSLKTYASASDSLVSQKWWNSLWSLQLPPKVKIFVWRICWNAIPSSQNLWTRNIVDSPWCNRCDAVVESPSHAIFWCKEVKKSWKSAGFDRLLAVVVNLHVPEVLSYASSLLGLDDLGRLCMIAWAI
ncbi:hypothetical protein Dsin_024384 [Dipteronia sinensis]|uniref:Reverse transcriptase zinc-binding domain-containing protein n=1 Tax=Dipteronia sinensis TaxID=43782 RepID=A0AAD9ZU45_9ROSI|nr:hypothetical protein Dsin_024384 [Dipteronia sinensis]